jgi:Holliday junction resolvase
MKKIYENDVKKNIRLWLELKGFDVYRINNAGVYNAKRKEFIWHGKKGMADLIAIKPPILLFIETKAPKKKPSVEQAEFCDKINKCVSPHALYADSLDMFIEKAKELGL